MRAEARYSLKRSLPVGASGATTQYKGSSIVRSTMLHGGFALALTAAFALTACTQSATNPAMNAYLAPGQASSDYQSSYRADPSFASSVTSPNVMQMGPMASGLKPNQTLGFGADQILTFTYQQQFDCVIQPFDDRNYSGKPAALDPAQFASPECQVGAPSTIDPSGASIKKTDALFVIVPFFETNKNSPAFSPALGKALKKLFGFVPDAFKPDPGVSVQCPAPRDKPATCTMHPLQTDLGPLLAALKLVPPKTTLYVPLVDHSHVLPDATINQKPEWWQVVVVLVENPKAWPNAKGTTGITSLAKLRAAQKAKQASADVGTNFFLYFGSQAMAKMMGSPSMPQMHT